MNLEEELRSKPLQFFEACQRSETCLAAESEAEEELRKAPPLFGGAEVGPIGSFLKWAGFPHIFLIYNYFPNDIFMDILHR